MLPQESSTERREQLSWTSGVKFSEAKYTKPFKVHRKPRTIEVPPPPPTPERADQIAERILSSYDGDDSRYAIREVGYSISLMMGAGFWNPVMEERVSRMAGFGCVYTERYTESIDAMIRNKFVTPEALDKHFAMSLNAYRRLGKRAGSYFIRGYPRMLELGQDVDAYYKQVDQAIEEGSSFFAAKFADKAPDVVAGGGDIDEFRTYAGLIKRKKLHTKLRLLI